MTTQPRGVRSNNPGNIDRDDTKWQGMADDQSSDPRFIVFKTPEWGIRAIARILLTYQSEEHLNTIRKIISRWAPPSENNTAAYIAAVAADCGVSADDAIDVDSVGVMLPLVKAIIAHEDAGYTYPDSVVLEALHMAGVADAKPKPLRQQNAFLTQIGTAGSLGVAAVAQGAGHIATYAPTVKSAADQLSGFADAPLIQHAVTILLTVGGGLTILGIAATMLKQKAS